MGIKDVVAMIHRVHQAAYATGSVEKPRDYFEKKLIPIQSEKELMRRIVDEAPGYDSSSTITRSWLAMLYQLVHLQMLMVVGAKPSDLEAAEKIIDTAKKAIQAKIGPSTFSYAIGLIPNPFATPKKAPEAEPFKEAFAAVDAELQRIKALALAQTLAEKTAQTVGAAVPGDVPDLKADHFGATGKTATVAAPSSLDVTPVTSVKAEISIGDDKLKLQLAAAERQILELTSAATASKQKIDNLEAAIIRLKAAHIEEFKGIGQVRFANMHKQDMLFAERYKEFEAIYVKSTATLIETIKGLEVELRGFSSNQVLTESKAKEKSKVEDDLYKANSKLTRFKAIKKAVEDLKFTYSKFFEGKVFAEDGKGLAALPVYDLEKERIRQTLSLIETANYLRTIHNTGHASALTAAMLQTTQAYYTTGTVECAARALVNQVDLMVEGYLSPDPVTCDLAKYHAKLGKFNEAWWTSLKEAVVAPQRRGSFAYFARHTAFGAASTVEQILARVGVGATAADAKKDTSAAAGAVATLGRPV